jgi:hypothetical protein
LGLIFSLPATPNVGNLKSGVGFQSRLQVGAGQYFSRLRLALNLQISEVAIAQPNHLRSFAIGRGNRALTREPWASQEAALCIERLEGFNLSEYVVDSP